MTYTFWQAVAETSWWTYLCFLYLLYIGYRTTKARTLQLKTLYILPAVFVLLFALALTTIIKFSLLNIGLWLGTFFIGTLLGWLQFYSLKIKAIKNENKLYIPGTWSLFLLIILLPILRYYFNYSFYLDTQTLLQGQYSFFLACLYGTCTGLMIGRLIYSRQCIKSGPYAAPA